MPCISSCLINLSRTSNIMLNRRHESRNPSLIPDLRERAFNLSLLNMMFTIGFEYVAFIILRWFPSILSLLSIFIRKSVGFCQVFFMLIEMAIFFFFPISFCGCCVLHWLIFIFGLFFDSKNKSYLAMLYCCLISLCFWFY